MTKPIGVISDTHGLLRPQAKGALAGCETILHAGDVGQPSVLEELGQVARVVAVRGNVDGGAWARQLPRMEYVQIGGVTTCIVHDIADLDLDVKAAGIGVVVYGHSHRPAADWKDGVLYLNPGSAGPKRFHLPVSVALLHVRPEGVTPEIITLAD